ncbi:DUF3077 domain-containing protein [Pseudomonas azotoformans]|uniref:DUF3077 domain-containing protein n=1 Tax=Pseudomonas azotoformans TaxID=47878 RepID=UPI001CB7AC1C|nr:DUF3077 domain-containing protein [Pseudomonas azotoformans]UMY49768.1 DUF3077 domain-containing protein [Pseudomonas azotoformans]
MKLFRVNAGVPLYEAVAAHLLDSDEMLALEAAMDPRAEKFIFASHYRAKWPGRSLTTCSWRYSQVVRIRSN